MYLRLMKLKMMPGKFEELARYYRERVLPALERTPGCLFGTLTENVGENVSISLTLWNTREHIQEYEERGLFQELLKGAEPLLAESAEWRFQLNDDLQLEYGPAKEEPTIRSYDIQAAMDDQPPSGAEAKGAYLRLLRINVTPDRAKQFRDSYRESAIPKFRSVKGCRFASLLSNLEMSSQLVSMTLWDSKQDAEAYERSSVFQDMLRDAREILGAERWHIALARGSKLTAAAAGSLPTSNFQVVAGRRFATR